MAARAIVFNGDGTWEQREFAMPELPPGGAVLRVEATGLCHSTSTSSTEGRSLYDHWRNGPKTLHGMMTCGFPNQFYIGYFQGGLNASIPEQLGKQGQHIAYVINEALGRGIGAVEPTQEAQDAYVRHFEEVEIDTSQFQRECTPSYYTNEGQVKAPWAILRPYGPGWTAFLKLLQDWRDDGRLEGLALTS